MVYKRVRGCSSGRSLPVLNFVKYSTGGVMIMYFVWLIIMSDFYNPISYISVRVVGTGRKTVISLDLVLYLPAKLLQMARCQLKNILLRPGELHVVMAMLRTIVSYIDSSGIDMCWIDSELYGPSTVKQMIDGKHVRRSKRAHMITLQAIFSLYLEAFLGGSPDGRRTRLSGSKSRTCLY